MREIAAYYFWEEGINKDGRLEVWSPTESGAWEALEIFLGYPEYDEDIVLGVFKIGDDEWPISTKPLEVFDNERDAEEFIAREMRRDLEENTPMSNEKRKARGI